MTGAARSDARAGRVGEPDGGPQQPEPVTWPREVVILGSTGSVGRQALEVIRRNPHLFRVACLAASGADPALLARQAVGFGAKAVAVARQDAAAHLRAALQAEVVKAARGTTKVPEILAGADAPAALAAWPCHVILNAMSGSAGLAATLTALDAGRTLATANKESLVAGAPLIRQHVAAGHVVPVDSEHSAIAQCLRTGQRHEVRRLILTASGGPFRGWSRARLTAAEPAQALAHPTWKNMGRASAVNSATLVSKGLEVIEAHLLFEVALSQIEVVVHPQSVVQSLVEFTDGATITQVCPPDMCLPIATALAWPHRVPGITAPVDWSVEHAWTLEPLDEETFQAVRLAREAAAIGGAAPAIYNAANEECVNAFLAGSIRFTRIVEHIAAVLHARDAPEKAARLDDILAADHWARVRARNLNSR